MDVLDKGGWPIVVGARVQAERGYPLTRVLPVTKHTKGCDDTRLEDEEKYGDAIPRVCYCPRHTEEYRPTDEGIVIALVPHPKYGTVIEVRDTTTHGLMTKLPTALTVQRGNTKKSTVYREMTDPSYRKARVARKSER